MAVTKSSNLFITGCDANTQWQLPWFVDNFKKHNPNAELLIFDFGMKNNPFPTMSKKHLNSDRGWFKKPSALMKASLVADKVCWLDTDCEVRANIEDVFNQTEKNKICMAEDVPWTKRRGGKWYNSGVIVYEGAPTILGRWATEVAYRPERGDQEVLHSMLDDMQKFIHIKDLPRNYNTLRIDLIDGSQPKQIKVMHWTGQKGNEEIRKQMNV
tara:strand:+ start:5937 stop:6575 length:639 start_codon:yes stop_codon:yes gene_type:complete